MACSDRPFGVGGAHQFVRAPVRWYEAGRMRLLFVSHSFPPRWNPMSNVGGMQRVAMDLHEELGRREDVELRSIVLRSSWRLIVPRAIPFITSTLARVPIAVARHGIDVVLFSSMTTALPVMGMGDRVRGLGAKVCAIVHGLDVTEPNPLYQAGVRRTLRQLDAVLPVSRATGDRCVERGMERARVRVVPNGVDLARFAGVAARRKGTRPAIDGLPEDAFLLISVGRQVRRKGFAWFVEHVMPKLPPHVHYWLAGSGPEHEAIAAAVKRAGVGDRVRLLGLVDEDRLRDLYVRGDLFVMPNVVVPGDMEGFGIVMLEAGACGLPTLAADLEGIRDVITEGENGFFAPTEQADAWVARVEELAADRDRLARVSADAAEFVQQHFSWKGVAERYLDELTAVEPRR